MVIRQWPLKVISISEIAVAQAFEGTCCGRKGSVTLDDDSEGTDTVTHLPVADLRHPTRYAYTVWFQNPSLNRDEEDHEWVAVFVVEAMTKEAAHSWGDHLARSYSGRNPEEARFRSSEVTTLDDPIWSRHKKPWDAAICWDECPVVVDGREATAEEIGW
jgi:hypothetical protein